MDRVNKTRSIAVDSNNKLVFPQISKLIEANPELGGGEILDNIVTDITDLQQTKSNRGELWFQGGSLACSNKWISNSYSFAMTFRMTPEEASLNEYLATSDYQWLGTCVYSTNQKGFCLSIDPNGTNETKLVVLAFGTKGAESKLILIDNFRSKYCDNKNHSLILVCNPSKLICQIDNDVYSGTPPVFDEIENTRAFTIFKNNSKISRVKYFNFDITDANAPYTIDDYLAGKDESPLLNITQPVINWHNLAGNTQSTTQTKGQSGTLELNRVEASYPRIFENGTFKVGYTYYIRLSGQVLFPSGQTGVSLRLSLPTNTAEITNNLTGEVVVSTPSNSQYAFGQGNGVEFDRTIKFIPTATNNDSNCLLYFNQIETDSNSYVNVSVRCDSALLSLADYSVDGKVLDISGNNNHATITGAVYGSKTSSVETFVETVIGNLTNNNDSLVVSNIYGKNSLRLSDSGASDTTALLDYDKIALLIGQNDAGANFDFNIDGTFTGYKHPRAGSDPDTNTGFNLSVNSGLNITSIDNNGIISSAAYTANGISLTDDTVTNELYITNSGITYNLYAMEQSTGEITLSNNGINIKPSPDYQSSKLIGGISITGDMIKLNGVPEEFEGANRVEITNKAIKFYDCYENEGLEIKDYCINFKNVYNSSITNLTNITIKQTYDGPTISIDGDKIGFDTELAIGKEYGGGLEIIQALVGEANIGGMLTTKLLRDYNYAPVNINSGEYTDCLLNKLSREYVGPDPDTEEPIFREHNLNGFDTTAVGLDYFYNVIKELNARIKELESASGSSTEPVDQIKLRIDGTDEYCIVKAKKDANGAITLSLE